MDQASESSRRAPACPADRQHLFDGALDDGARFRDGAHLLIVAVGGGADRGGAGDVGEFSPQPTRHVFL